MDYKEEIRNTILRKLEELSEPFPCNSNRASALGHPCLKHLVLMRTHWKEAERSNPKLQSRFMKGVSEEKEFKRIMTDELSYEITKSGSSFRDEKLQISGSIDGMIKKPNWPSFLPFEFKGFATHLYGSINTFQDMMNHKYYFVRKYPAQMQIYLYLMGLPMGLFMFWDKDIGIESLKIIEVELDYDYVEGLLKRAETVNKHMAEETQPDFHKDISLCTQCSMRFVCKPPIERTEREIVSDEIIVEKFQRMMELEPYVSEHNGIKRELKKPFEGKSMMIGNYLIQGRWIERDGYTVKASRYWRPEYIPIEKEKK